MGRKKNYDRDTLIEKAMDIFWEHGYSGTSTQMLVEELEVNRFSLYAEFGSKQNLFEVTLEHYNKKVLEQLFGPLETPTSGVEEIRDLFLFLGTASNGSFSGRGCLMCNTSVEFGPEYPTVGEFVPRYFERLSGAFYKALSNAHSKGELRNSVALREKADFFTASTLGLTVMIRAKASPAIVENAAKMAIEHLEGLCV